MAIRAALLELPLLGERAGVRADQTRHSGIAHGVQKCPAADTSIFGVAAASPRHSIHGMNASVFHLSRHALFSLCLASSVSLTAADSGNLSALADAQQLPRAMHVKMA